MGCKLLAGKGWFNLDSSLGSRNSWTGIADSSESCLLEVAIYLIIHIPQFSYLMFFS
jgi:hypothetical protein